MQKTRLDPKDLPIVEATTLRRILAVVRPYWRRAALVVTRMAGGAGLNLCLPIFVRRVVDEAIPRGDLKGLWLYCAAMIAGPAAAGLLDVVQKYASELIGQQVMLDLRTALYRQFHAMPFAFFASQQPGEAVSHVLNDVQGVGGAVSSTLVDIVQNVIALATTTVFVFTRGSPRPPATERHPLVRRLVDPGDVPRDRACTRSSSGKHASSQRQAADPAATTAARSSTAEGPPPP